MSRTIWWAFVALLSATSCAGQHGALVVDTTEPTPVHSTIYTSSSATVDDSTEHPSRDDVLALIEIRRLCGRTPERCAFLDIAVPDSPYDRALRNLMRERLELGLRTLNGEFRPTVTAIQRHGPREATVHTCIYDALVLYDTKTIPGAHIVFDDLAVSILSTWSIRLHEGRWKWHSEEVTRHVLMRDACS